MKEKDKNGLIEFTSHTPKELQDRNNDLSPLPDQLMPHEVSPFNAKHFDGEIPSDKLISHVGIKNHIVRHFVEIQESIRQGEVIDQIDKILRFLARTICQSLRYIKQRPANEKLLKLCSRDTGKFLSSCSLMISFIIIYTLIGARRLGCLFLFRYLI